MVCGNIGIASLTP
ncbi:hypothetical protein L1D56_11940 [Vibrio diabolicus]|nr:hypothetical protein [Vibrio diabolicus]